MSQSQLCFPGGHGFIFHLHYSFSFPDSHTHLPLSLSSPLPSCLIFRPWVCFKAQSVVPIQLTTARLYLLAADTQIYFSSFDLSATRQVWISTPRTFCPFSSQSMPCSLPFRSLNKLFSWLEHSPLLNLPMSQVKGSKIHPKFLLWSFSWSHKIPCAYIVIVLPTVLQLGPWLSVFPH